MDTADRQGASGSRYRRPHAVPERLDLLQGPSSGTVHLPSHLDWSGNAVYDLDPPGRSLTFTVQCGFRRSFVGRGSSGSRSWRSPPSGWVTGRASMSTCAPAGSTAGEFPELTAVVAALEAAFGMERRLLRTGRSVRCPSSARCPAGINRRSARGGAQRPACATRRGTRRRR